MKNVVLPNIETKYNKSLNQTKNTNSDLSGTKYNRMIKTNNMIYNKDNKNTNNMKNQLYVLEDFANELVDEYDLHKDSVNSLYQEQIGATLYLNDYFKKISNNVYETLYNVDEFTKEEFKLQGIENMKFQSQIDYEKKDNSTMRKKYLELMERLNNLYLNVGLEDPNLESKNR